MYKHINITPNKNDVGAVIDINLINANHDVIEEI